MTHSKLATKIAAAALFSTALAIQPSTSHAATVTPLALSECPSGYFCVWSGTNFSGSVQKISSTNSYRPISLTATRSYYNHRTQRTWLHEVPDGSGSTLCINPGATKASTTGWQTTAEAAYLATITNC